jgi:hypothetical protein
MVTEVLKASPNLGNCAGAGTIVATIAAGPLNYAGANPKVSCR